MKLNDLRASARGAEVAVEVALEFLDTFFGGAFGPAQKLVTTDFSWFGQTALDWRSPHLAAFVREHHTTVSNPRLLEPSWLEVMPVELKLQAFGPLEPGDSVVLVDLTRCERCSTATLVISGLGPKAKVRRVLDAMAFKTAVEAAQSQDDSPPKP